MIVEELLESAKESLKGKEATDVRIGLSYTGVSLDDQSLGVAYSFGGEAPECCEVVDSAGDSGETPWSWRNSLPPPPPWTRPSESRP